MSTADNSNTELRTLFNAYDRDSSGYIGIIEFISLARSLNSTITEDAIKQAFHRIDSDDDGLLSFEEFQAWWTDR